METLVETQDLTVHYGDIAAVRGITLTARSGEILGLLGPNGAGKTSVIRALTTIVPVTSGTASVAGHPLSDETSVRASIGVLPESNGYPSAQTAPGYLRYYGQLFGLSASEAQDRAGQLLARMGLEGNRNRISTFSRGMRQRLGLARALINSPLVLFLDEPTLGLDPAGKEDILAQLARAAVEDGTCVILCSHLLDEVERVCDRVAIMNDGRIVAEGSVDQVIAVAGVVDRGRIRVAPDDVANADQVLRRGGEVLNVGYDNTRPGDLDIELATEPHAAATMLRSLLDAGVEPVSFDLRGARLSDAFLALTNGSTP